MSRLSSFEKLNSLKLCVLIYCSVSIILLFPVISVCADSTEVVVPDGTEGSTMNVNKVDTVLKTKHWYELENDFTTLKIGGGMLVDYASFLQDSASRQQIRLIPEVAIRDFRFLLSGKIKTKRFLTWKTGIMYDGNKGSWFIRETGLTIGVPEIAGYLFVGRTKVGTSLNKVMNGYAGWGIERMMALDMVQLLADGIKWMGYLPKQRIFWNAGAYTDLISYKQTFSSYSGIGAIRFGWMPYYDSKKNVLVHLGVNYSYGRPENGKIQLRSRPEANTFPYFIETPIFKADHGNMLGCELYFSYGSLMIGSEAYYNKFSSAEADNPGFKGGAVFANYIITGQVHPYTTVSNIYGFVPVENSVFSGGAGAIEIVLQYSTHDLNGGNLKGGKMWRITPMLNWYMSNNVRMELVYGYGKLNRFNLLGTTQFFQSRLMFIF